MNFSSTSSEISDYSEYRLELDALVQGTDDQWLYNTTDIPPTLSSSTPTISFNIVETSPGKWNFLEDDDDTESVGSLYDFDTFTDEKLFGIDATGFDKALIDLELKNELETVELLKPLELESDSFTLPDEVQLYLDNCSSVIEKGEQSGLSPDEINFMLFSNLSTSHCIPSSPTKVPESLSTETFTSKIMPSYSTLSRASTSRPVTVVKSHQKTKSLFIKPTHEFVSKIPQFKASTPSLCSSLTSSTTSSRRSTIFSPPTPSSPTDSPISFDNACKYPSLSRNSLQALSKGSQKFPSRIPRLSRTIDPSQLDAVKILKRCSIINPLSWQTPAQPLVDVHRPLVNRSSLPASRCNLNWKAQLSQYRPAI